tara:strand:+ start:1944 stop:2213 length:270 start_codon:yes stop_codon:yes gene_type:complete
MEKVKDRQSAVIATKAKKVSDSRTSLVLLETGIMPPQLNCALSSVNRRRSGEDRLPISRAAVYFPEIISMGTVPAGHDLPEGFRVHPEP